MDHIEAEQDGNVQSRFGDGDVLQAVYFCGIGDEEERADLLAANAVVVRDRVGFLICDLSGRR
jgi:hypothetical protein